MVPPPIHTPAIPKLPPARRWRLGNGLEVLAVHVEQAPILAVEIIWRAGRPYEQKRIVAGATNSLLTEGTRNYTAGELESFFEQYGTSLYTPDNFDTGNLAIATILRHAEPVLTTLTEVIAEPSFSEVEFVRYLKRSRQNLRENLQDPDTLAYRFISEAAFGSDTPYGYNGIKPDYEALQLDDVWAHYRRCFGAANATLRITGQLSGEVERLLEATFGQLDPGQPVLEPEYIATSQAPRILQLHRPRAQQTMIRRGRRGFRITEPDYPGLFVLDTILGGYFGSRLMRNIREEKGFTYGIDSDLDTYRFDGSFGISADVANENLSKVREEILTEMDKLRQEPVPAAELDRVRAYLLGTLVTDLDGPMAVSQRHRSALIKNYDAADQLRRIDATIRNITAAELLDLAQRHLRPEQDWEVIVGGAGPIEGAQQITDLSYPLGRD